MRVRSDPDQLDIFWHDGRISNFRVSGARREIRDPADRRRLIGTASDATPAEIDSSLSPLARNWRAWDERGGATRADILDRAADLIEAARDEFLFLLAREAGYSLDEGWIVASVALYLLTGLFWLPVVWMQMRMRALAEEAAETDGVLPEVYHRFFRAWFVCGFPAFAAVLGIFWLMIARPPLWA